MSTANRTKSILIIEDDEGHRAHINNYADARTGVSFIIKEDVSSALKYLENMQRTHNALPGILLVNYKAIKETDQALFEELKKRDLRGCLPVIALNNSDEKSVIDEAYDRGVSSYCIKPRGNEEWHSLFTIFATGSMRSYFPITT